MTAPPADAARRHCLRLLGGSVLLAGAPSCSLHHESNVETGLHRRILHMGNGDEPQGLDPHTITGIPEAHIVMALFEGLCSRNPVTLDICPGVAESWTVSADGRHYGFKLRGDARWSNGDPLRAGDFVYSWHRCLMPALGNDYAYLMFYVRNARKFFKGELSDFDEVGVRAADDHTLLVDLENPAPFFPQLLCHHSYYPVNPAVIGKFGAMDERDTRWTRPGNLVGNGPFTLARWVMNRILTVKKNRYYWDAKRVRLNQIHFYPVQNASTEERMFRTGQLHITDHVPTGKIAVYRKRHPQLLRISPYLGTYFYRFNTKVKPLDDMRVRRALAMSIDRGAIVTDITKGGQAPAFNLTPPDLNAYRADARIPYDVDGARRLMADAGHAHGQGVPVLELAFNTSEQNMRIAVAIQEMWKQALNVDVSLVNQDWKVFLDRDTRLDYQIHRGSWIGDFLDPVTFLGIFSGGGGNNRTGWNNARYDALLRGAARSPDQAKRYALLRRAERILMAEAPIAPIYFYTSVRLVSPDVHGWDPNLLDRHPYKYVYLEHPTRT